MLKRSLNMQIFRKEITEILFSYNPIGVPDIFWPDNENDYVTTCILHSLRDVKDLTELRWMVYDVFLRLFGEDLVLPRNNSCYRHMAEEIWDLWQEMIPVFETVGEETVEKVDKKILHEAISEILYQHQPLTLMKFGVPDDEYTTEVSDIILQLQSASDVRSLKWSIYEVFLKYYPPESIAPYGDECYQCIAEKIWDLWQEAAEYRLGWFA